MWLLITASIYFMFYIIFGVPYAMVIIGIEVIIATLLSIFSVRKTGRYDGQITVETTESGGKLFSLLIEDEPEDLENRNLVTFKIVSKAS